LQKIKLFVELRTRILAAIKDKRRTMPADATKS